MRSILLLPVLAACSTSMSTPDASTDGATDAATDTSCADLAAARCNKRDMCTMGLGNQRVYGDLATCKTRDALGCMAALHATGTSATSPFYEGCAQAVANETCTDWFNAATPAACVPAPGSKANGQSCSFNAQCVSTWCSIGTGRACGVCADLPKTGDACATAADCGRGLDCASANVCAAPVGMDGVCDTMHPCAAGLTCVGMMMSGTCKASGTTVGTACDPKHQTAAGCDGSLGLVCISAMCAKITFVSAGGQCGTVADGGMVESISDCTGGAMCVMPQGSKTGTCVAPAADNAACDLVNGPPCLPPARCVTSSDASSAGVCTLPSSNACN
jgi:hypothetical protein